MRRFDTEMSEAETAHEEMANLGITHEEMEY